MDVASPLVVAAKPICRSMAVGQVLMSPVRGGVLWEKVRAIGPSGVGVVFALFRWVLGRCVRATVVYEDGGALELQGAFVSCMHVFNCEPKYFSTKCTHQSGKNPPKRKTH